jgi:hypothetical protein
MVANNFGSEEVNLAQEMVQDKEGYRFLGFENQ